MVSEVDKHYIIAKFISLNAMWCVLIAKAIRVTIKEKCLIIYRTRFFYYIFLRKKN